MSRPDYVQVKMTPSRQQHVDGIGAVLGIDPDGWGNTSRIIEFALADCYLRLARGKEQEEEDGRTV